MADCEGPGPTSTVEDFVSRAGASQENIIPVLQAVQKEYGYVPEGAVDRLADLLDISPARIFGIITFYNQFRTVPCGRRMLRVCQGTACHVRGSALVLEALERELGIEAGQTTEDGGYTLETVSCMGACAMGPVVVVDDEYHSTTPGKAPEFLDSIGKGAEGDQ